jgi:hypothetical protein
VSSRPEPLEIDLTTNDVFPIEVTPEVEAACEEESRAFVEAQRWKWLESTRQLQEEFYGAHYPMKEGEGLANYVTTNHSALVSEAGELLAEFGWKPWAQPRGWVNRANALKEAVDVAHFLGNILCAIGVTDEEWEEAYRKKQEVNRQRQRDGYDGVSGKCPGCKRSYDDGIECTPLETVTEINPSGSVCVELEVAPARCAYT